MRVTELNSLMTLAEVCAWLRMSEQVVKKLCREGKIPAVKIGKFWRFNVEELSGWVKSQK
jgi:excisionase family DNA binding protein